MPSLLSSIQPRCGSHEWRKAVPQSPPSLPRPTTRKGRAPAGRTDRRGGIDRAQHPGPARYLPGCPSSWGQTAARGGRRAPWTLGTTSRTSRTRPASRSLRLCAQQPSPAASRAPTRRRSAPGDRDQAAHRPAGASLAGEPLACPSPYLLQPGPLPPSLAFDSPASRAPAPHRPAPGPPQPAHGPSAPRRSAPRPPVNTPPLPRPRLFAAREGHCWDRRGTLRKANCGCFRAKLALPTTAPRNQAVGGCGDPLILRGIPTPALNTILTRDLDLPIALWLRPSPPDSAVGTGRGRQLRVLTPHDFDSARRKRRS